MLYDMKKEYLEIVDKILNKLNFEDDNSIIEFIDTMISGIYFGKNIEGDNITVTIENKFEMRISTYQRNNWIRIMDYQIEIDDLTKQRYLVKTENYEK